MAETLDAMYEIIRELDSSHRDSQDMRSDMSYYPQMTPGSMSAAGKEMMVNRRDRLVESLQRTVKKLQKLKIE